MKKSVLIITTLFLTIGLIFGQNFSAFAEEGFSTDDTITTEEDAGFTEAEAEEAEHVTFSSEMLAAAKDRFGLNRRMRLFNALPSPADSGKILESASMPYTGNAYTVAFHVSFQDQSFVEGDTQEALQKAIGKDVNGKSYTSFYSNQYSSLHDYYQRASYGKLAIYGDTYSYQAQKKKSEYKDSAELVKEVMDAMDADIDFRRYDANKDGLIDCIYLHIPYDPADEWNSIWWPNCGSLLDEEMYYENDGDGGVQAASRIILSRKLTADDEVCDGVRTLIHESGHAMGFPDY